MGWLDFSFANAKIQISKANRLIRGGLQFKHKIMNSLESTPSVYFAFEDTAKRTRRSEDAFFQLSNTIERSRDNPPIMFNLKPVPLDFHSQPETHKPNIKVKTEEFFQEFDKNFVVTFEQSTKTTSQVSELPELSNHSITKPDEDNCSKISLSVCRQRDTANQGESSAHRCRNKEKSSPIPSFQVKKRTVFKSKQNIQYKQLNLKQTQKKIYNKDTLQVLKGSSHSCKIREPEKPDKHLFLTLKVGKAGQLDSLLQVRNNNRSTIFQQEDHDRGMLRLESVDDWRKLIQKKKSLQEHTCKPIKVFSRSSRRQR